MSFAADPAPAFRVTQVTSPWVTSAAQSGVWTTGRTWTLLNSTDSVNAVQSGTWSTGRTWSLLNSTDSVNAVQSGTWSTGRTWSLLNSTDSVNAVQSGIWSLRLLDGSGNLISSQVSGSQRALDVGINVAGVQVDPRTRSWTLSSGGDSVSAVQSGTWNINNISGTVSLPTGASTSANQSTEITSLQLIDDAMNANDTALSKGVPIFGQLDDVSTTTVTENNVAPARITAARGLHLNLRNNAGTEIGVKTSPLAVEVVDGTRATYSAAITDLSAATLATDVFTITGSATKTVRIVRVLVSGTETTGAVRDIQLVKRSTANSGGTSTTPTVVPFDSGDAAGTAVVRAYTVNPTLGTTVGMLYSAAYEVPASNLSGASSALSIDFGVNSAREIVLRGTGDVLAVNLNGVTLAGSNLNFTIIWTEE